MIREIVCDIADIVRATGYVNTHFEYCEIIARGDISYPAQYVSAGNYEQVFNNDVNGNSYLRKNGDISYSDYNPSVKTKYPACGGSPFKNMTIPLRLVMVVPRNKLGNDAFSDDLLAREIQRVLSSSLSVSIYGVTSMSYNVTSTNTDSLSIWKEEVKGMEYQMNFAYSYIAINFNVVAIVNPDCLTEICPPY